MLSHRRDEFVLDYPLMPAYRRGEDGDWIEGTIAYDYTSGSPLNYRFEGYGMNENGRVVDIPVIAERMNHELDSMLPAMGYVKQPAAVGGWERPGTWWINWNGVLTFLATWLVLSTIITGGSSVRWITTRPIGCCGCGYSQVGLRDARKCPECGRWWDI